LEEYKQIIDKNNENLHTSEKLIYQAKNNEGSGSKTANRYYNNLNELKGRKTVHANHHSQTINQQLNKTNLKSAVVPCYS
jgi:hypothetical protein